MEHLQYFLFFILIVGANSIQKWEMIQSTTSPDTQTKEANDLVKRLIPNHNQLFQIKVLGPDFAPKNTDVAVLMTQNSFEHSIHNFYPSNVTRLI